MLDRVVTIQSQENSEFAWQMHLVDLWFERPSVQQDPGRRALNLEIICKVIILVCLSDNHQTIPVDIKWSAFMHWNNEILCLLDFPWDHLVDEYTFLGIKQIDSLSFFVDRNHLNINKITLKGS